MTAPLVRTSRRSNSEKSSLIVEASVWDVVLSEGDIALRASAAEELRNSRRSTID
jgi:hypothetical protein